MEAARTKLLENVNPLGLEQAACTLLTECFEDMLWDSKVSPIQIASSVKLPDLEKVSTYAPHFYESIQSINIFRTLDTQTAPPRDY